MCRSEGWRALFFALRVAFEFLPLAVVQVRALSDCLTFLEAIETDQRSRLRPEGLGDFAEMNSWIGIMHQESSNRIRRGWGPFWLGRRLPGHSKILVGLLP
jgi:hypothetical protein